MSTLSDDLAQRKAQHLEICLDEEKYPTQTGRTFFDQVNFYHRSLPEINLEALDLRTEILGFTCRAPLFISCMTGGSSQGYRLNKDLARAAEALKIPVGMGSNRILWKKPETLSHFQFRKFAPTVPILSNIGAVQVRDMKHSELIEMNKRLEVTAQVIHLNPGQELFQPEGDRDFRGIKEAIFRFIAASPHPVILKETGFGIHPREVEEFLAHGAYALDLAGAGGTNWITVEAHRSSAKELERSRQFDHWGHPTALLLGALRGTKGLWASGGILTGMDVAKALALGAQMVGIARGFAQAVYHKGEEGVLQYFNQLEKTLKEVMLLTGSQNLKELSQTPLWFSPTFDQMLNQYQKGL